jgi:hypothetical protein
MRITIIRGTIARRSTDDPRVEERLMGLPLRDVCNFTAFCAAHNRPRDLRAFEAWAADRLPGRGSNPLVRVVA